MLFDKKTSIEKLLLLVPCCNFFICRYSDFASFLFKITYAIIINTNNPIAPNNIYFSISVFIKSNTSPSIVYLTYYLFLLFTDFPHVFSINLSNSIASASSIFALISLIFWSEILFVNWYSPSIYSNTF